MFIIDFDPKPGERVHSLNENDGMLSSMTIDAGPRKKVRICGKESKAITII